MKTLNSMDQNLSFDHRHFSNNFHILIFPKSYKIENASLFASELAHNYTQKSFLLVFPMELTRGLIKSSFEKSNKNGLMYIFSHETNKWNWFQVFTIANNPQIVVSDLKFGK